MKIQIQKLLLRNTWEVSETVSKKTENQRRKVTLRKLDHRVQSNKEEGPALNQIMLGKVQDVKQGRLRIL
jgi:hypothetical protein